MTIKRKAILISSPDAPSPSNNLLPGTQIDVLKWKRFLKSPEGGSWVDDEIILYEYSKHKSLLKFIKQQGTLDYLFLVYSGHGILRVTDSLIYESPNNEVSITDVEDAARKITAKATLIFDACRCEARNPFGGNYAPFKQGLNESYNPKSVQKWEYALNHSSITGIITIQSCQMFETSSMQKDNESSLFSDKMLESVTDSSVKTIGDAFIYAEKETKKIADTWQQLQHPQIQLDGSVYYPSEAGKLDYPFVIR